MLEPRHGPTSFERASIREPGRDPKVGVLVQQQKCCTRTCIETVATRQACDHYMCYKACAICMQYLVLQDSQDVKIACFGSGKTHNSQSRIKFSLAVVDNP